jgi:D-alanyl-lipoteichoic acid acyltransferase DltB (MBOAT superfamily)
VALGLEWVSLRHLRRAATTDQVREWLRVPTEMGRLGMIAMLTLLVAGFYMMATTWHGVAWILVALGAIVVMILPMALTRRRMAVIERTANTERGVISPALSQLLHDPVLTTSLQTRVAIALGIVFLMTVKPGLGGSLLTMVVAVLLGFVSTLPMPRRATRTKGKATDLP